MYLCLCNSILYHIVTYTTNDVCCSRMCSHIFEKHTCIVPTHEYSNHIISYSLIKPHAGYTHRLKNVQSTTYFCFHTEMASPTVTKKKKRKQHKYSLAHTHTRRKKKKPLTLSDDEQHSTWRLQAGGVALETVGRNPSYLCWAYFHLDWNREA